MRRPATSFAFIQQPGTVAVPGGASMRASCRHPCCKTCSAWALLDVMSSSGCSVLPCELRQLLVLQHDRDRADKCWLHHLPPGLCFSFFQFSLPGPYTRFVPPCHQLARLKQVSYKLVWISCHDRASAALCLLTAGAASFTAGLTADAAPFISNLKKSCCALQLADAAGLAGNISSPAYSFAVLAPSNAAFATYLAANRALQCPIGSSWKGS